LAACQHLLAECARSCDTRSLSPESPLQENPQCIRGYYQLSTGSMRTSENSVHAKFAFWDFCEVRIFCALGVWEVADVPGMDLSRSLRAMLHNHAHLLPERVLADRTLDVSDRFHRPIAHLQEAISPPHAGEG
jgi:hypothetical protein